MLELSEPLQRWEDDGGAWASRASSASPNRQVLPQRPYERAWTLTGSDQAGHERFKQLARRAIADVGYRFSEPDEAVDNWLGLVFEYWKAGRLHDEDDWCLQQVAEKSTLYCGELATCFHEAANLEAERTFTELVSQFRQLPKDLRAIRRTEALPKPIAVRTTAQDAVDFWEKVEREAVDHASIILGARLFAEGDFREWKIINGVGKDPEPAVFHEVELLMDLMSRAGAGPTGAMQPDGWKSFLDQIRSSPSYRVIGNDDKTGAESAEIRGLWLDERGELQQLGLFKVLATYCRNRARLARCGLAIGGDNSAAGPGLSQFVQSTATHGSDTQMPDGETSSAEFFDLNNPAKIPYEYREFPDTIYHHEKPRNRVVQSAKERSAYLAQGWRREAYPREEAPEPTAEPDLRAQVSATKPDESTGKDARPAEVTKDRSKRLRATVYSPAAARKMAAYMENHGGQTDFAGKAQTTDRTLRSFRTTGRVRRDIFAAIAFAMGTTPDELLKPE